MERHDELVSWIVHQSCKQRVGDLDTKRYALEIYFTVDEILVAISALRDGHEQKPNPNCTTANELIPWILASAREAQDLPTKDVNQGVDTRLDMLASLARGMRSAALKLIESGQSIVGVPFHSLDQVYDSITHIVSDSALPPLQAALQVYVVADSSLPAIGMPRDGGSAQVSCPYNTVALVFAWIHHTAVAASAALSESRDSTEPLQQLRTAATLRGLRETARQIVELGPHIESSASNSTGLDESPSLKDINCLSLARLRIDDTIASNIGAGKYTSQTSDVEPLQSCSSFQKLLQCSKCSSASNAFSDIDQHDTKFAPPKKGFLYPYPQSNVWPS